MSFPVSVHGCFSVCSSVCLFVPVSLCRPVYFSLSLSVPVSLCLSLRLSICLYHRRPSLPSSFRLGVLSFDVPNGEVELSRIPIPPNYLRVILRMSSACKPQHVASQDVLWGHQPTKRHKQMRRQTHTHTGRDRKTDKETCRQAKALALSLCLKTD